MDKDAMLAALPEMIPQICDPEIEWVEDPQRADGRVYPWTRRNAHRPRAAY
jgi:hypothetical protein